MDYRSVWEKTPAIHASVFPITSLDTFRAALIYVPDHGFGSVPVRRGALNKAS